MNKQVASINTEIETVRLVRKADIPQLKNVLDSSGLFSSELLDDLIADFLSKENSKDYWFTCEVDGNAVSIGCAELEAHTKGTYRLLGIGVHKHFEKRGLAKKTMIHMEKHLAALGGRILIVETIKAEGFEVLKDLYYRLGLQIEGTIKDFHDEGVDKVIFKKRLDK